ncbi:MAG: tRNA (adenosine(37)-N6)-dimethylallyltransferase MiaA [Bacteroidales bacterium]|nr:tRNA (adenosine(37)-N6)-dimethylallyltransferase MiaA [Bacteroidales bacterium]
MGLEIEERGRELRLDRGTELRIEDRGTELCVGRGTELRIEERGTEPLLVVLGPTACGKTRYAVELAQRVGGEIVSADSRQVYRGMDIGTGKDLEEYTIEDGTVIPAHLIDICPAGYKYTLYEWLRDAREAIKDIRSRGRRPIVCGGTGLYIESLLKGLSLPEVAANPQLRASLAGKSLQELTAILSQMKQLHNTTDVDTAQRAIRAIEIQTYYQHHPEAAGGQALYPIHNAYLIGLDPGREERRRRIETRLDARLQQGLIEEVKGLLDSGIAPEDLIYYGLEYKYVTLHLTGALSRQEMRDRLLIAIHQFAKRQMTWWRGMERRLPEHPIHWLRGATEAEK